MTSNWPRTCDCQTYPVYTKFLPPRPKFWSVSPAVFEIQGCRICTEWPQNDREYLKIKIHCIQHGTLYIHSTCPRCPKFGPFRCRKPAVLEVQKCLKSEKSEMHRATSGWYWTHNYLQNPVHTKYLPSRSKSFFPFSSTPACFEIKGCRNRNNRKYAEWPQGDLG